MPQDKKDWKEFERVAVEVQKQLAPDAKVCHSETIVGKSGEHRKVDITVRQKIGACPVFIGMDCKYRTRPVSVGQVEAFQGQLDDVSADLGVIISNAGFTRTAKAVAARSRIVLQTLRQAEEADWQRLVGGKAWLSLTRVDSRKAAAIATSRQGEQFNVPIDTVIHDAAGNRLDVLSDLFWQAWKELPPPRPIGIVSSTAEMEQGAAFISIGEVRVEINSVRMSAELVARQWAVNLKLAHGRVLRDGSSSEILHGEFTSDSFDWAEIMRTRPYTELTPEQYEKVSQESKQAIDLSKVKRFLRLIVSHRPK